MAQRGQKRAADDDGEAAFLADLDGLFEPDEPTALVEAKKQKGRPLGSVSGPTSRPTHFLKACVDAKAGKAWLMELPSAPADWEQQDARRAPLHGAPHPEGGPRRPPSRCRRMTPTPRIEAGQKASKIHGDLIVEAGQDAARKAALPDLAQGTDAFVLIDMITLTDGEGGVYARLFSSSTMLNIGKKAAAVYGEDNILCVTDGKHKTEAAGWIIIPFGTSTRYFDRDKGKYSNKFLPIAYIFTKSETKDVFTFAHAGTVKALSVFMGVKSPNVRDRSSHVLKGPPPRPRKVRGDDDDEEQESEDECPVDEEAAREIGEALVKRARYTITIPQERMRSGVAERWRDVDVKDPVTRRWLNRLYNAAIDESVKEGTPVWLDGLEDAALEAARVQYIQEDVDWRHYDKFEELFEGFLSEFNLERTKERRAWVKGIACAHLKRGQEAEKGDGVVADKRDAAGSPRGEPQVAVRHVF
ncbi:hypothetical protein JL720_8539 [Aureococcus anophagefferens]|nr:hypothetical protein JL720_8539 [Aureococcus anophagefferens]